MFGAATTLVCWMLLIAFSAAGAVQLIRQLAFVQRQMLRQRKPWICNLCMSFWTTIVATGMWTVLEHAPLAAAIPAFALTLHLVNKLTEPQSKPDFEEVLSTPEPLVFEETQ